MAVDGTFDPRFGAVVEALEANLASGADLGASLAVVLDGETVIDVWGGWADGDRTRPWERDTITNVWSTTKTMMALCALVLADRGELDLDAPVARYWPEFAAAGKDGILVRHLMSHTSGVAGWDPPFDVNDIYDWDTAVAHLAAQAPWWEPGTASGYHGINQGHLVGEVVRRITGTSLGTFFANEIAGPLGADFHIGLDAAADGRVSPIVPPPPLEVDASTLDPTSPMFRFFTGPVIDPSVANTEAWRRAEIPAANGHGNARSVARVQSVVSHGGEIDGVRLLSPATIDRIFEEQSRGVDLCLGLPLAFGIGYGLPVPETIPYLPADGRVCFWGGWGGSVIINDLDHRMSFAYMMNVMEAGIIGGTRAESLLRPMYAALGVDL